MPTRSRRLSRPAILLCAALGLLAACRPASPTPSSFQKGFNYTAWWQGELATPESDHSLALLAGTGADWVAIVVFGSQETHTSTEVRRDLPHTPTDEDVIHAVARAHGLGLRVMLKPHVDLHDDRDHWRGDVGAGFTTEAEWNAWFRSYAAFIDHYAELAQDQGVEQFCIGTELVGTTHREEAWREIIAGVRQRYDGPITYAANHSGEETAITWWDDVDLIGVDAYYVLSESLTPSVDELKAAWVDRGYVSTLAGLASRYDRPVLITEIGYRSVDGAVRTPWDWKSEGVDLQEQADAYQAALAVLWDQPWLAGIYWWQWDVNPQQGGETSTSFSPRGKPAEAVLLAYYGGSPTDAEPPPSPEPLPISATVAATVTLPALQPAPGAQDGWRTYTRTDQVTDLVFDRAGDLWIGTPGGAIRWDVDGGTALHYTAAHGLAHDWVEVIATGPDGDLWLGTSGGISRYDGQTWTQYTADDSLACNGVTDVAFGASGDVWVTTFGCGVSRFDGETWTTYAEADGLAEDHAMCAAAPTEGVAWFGTWRGLSRFDGQYWTTYTNTHGLADDHVRAIAVDPDGPIWLGTWTGGITRLNGTLWTSFGSDDGVGDRIESIGVTLDGTVWAGGLDLLSRFDETAWRWTPYGTIDGQPDDRGPALTVGPDGTLWAGTYARGIYHLGEIPTAYTIASDGPTGNRITALALAPDGSMWVGARPDRYEKGGGVSRFDGEAWTTYTAADGLPGDHVTALAVGRDGSVWAGGEGGLARFDGQAWITATIGAGPVTALTAPPGGGVWVGIDSGLFFSDGRTATEHLAGVRVTALAAGPEGGVWAGSDGGLYQFDQGTWTHHLPDRAIAALAVGDDGTVWAAGSGELARFDGGAWIWYTAGGDVRALGLDPDGAVWIAGRNGVAHFDGQAWMTHASTSARAIAVTPEGDVWIGTDGGGVSRYRPSLGRQ